MELIESYRGSVQTWHRALDGIGDWDAPTPCGDWSVRALTNHVAGEELWSTPLAEGKTIAEVGDRFDGDILGDDPSATARAAAAEAIQTAEAYLPTVETVQLSYGEEKFEEYLRQLQADHLIHAWDLLAATGQDRTLDAELVAAVADWFRDREALYRQFGVIAARPDRPGGDPQSDLLLAFGRDPDWSPDAP